MDECVMSGSRYGTSSEIMIRKAIRNREIDIYREVTLNTSDFSDRRCENDPAPRFT